MKGFLNVGRQEVPEFVALNLRALFTIASISAKSREMHTHVWMFVWEIADELEAGHTNELASKLAVFRM